MREFLAIVFFLFFSFLLQGQVGFKMIIQDQPVVVNESFQVQFIIEDAEKIANFKPPPFNNYRLITGPNIYTGSVTTYNGTKSLKNYVYTLVAVKPGRFTMAGATAIINGKLLQSNEAFVKVISQKDALQLMPEETMVNPDYYLKTGEDVYEKINKNLFLKVTVNKRNCYVGEPVLATFKLYSRLQSRSDIVKNPGFYGFTVYDMVSLGDKQSTTENISGKLFDVHTIRKVQLYPLQAGSFTIDAMEVKNQVAFSRSAIHKKTEQQIVEGILGNDNGTPDENTEIFENDIHTEEIAISVKPSPVKNKPLAFGGATGVFRASVAAIKDRLAKNEEGMLEITIKGRGNFTQVNTPAVQWPSGIEGFEPSVKDSLDKTQSPLTGSRTFRYGFVSDKPGAYIIPGISFSFFDPDSGDYKTIVTRPVPVSISPEEKMTGMVTDKKEIKKAKPFLIYWIAAGMALLLCLLGLFWSVKSRKKPTLVVPVPEIHKPPLAVDEILASASLAAEGDDKNFYARLHQSVWKFFADHYNLSGSMMNKENLLEQFKTTGVASETVRDIQHILQECEAGIFTGAGMSADKQQLLQRVKEILEKINGPLL